MAFQRYASFQVLSATIAGPEKARLQATAIRSESHRAVFQYDPRPGFLYVRSRAISSRCNDNYDEFPAPEIAQGYLSFVGKPVFINHQNSNHRRSRGVIVDAVLHEDRNPDGSPDTWCEVLMEVDALRFPRLASLILDGSIDRTSMGCDVDYSLCSFCGNKASTPLEYCRHIPKMKGQRIRRVTASGQTEDVLVREICYGLRFFENSLLVEEPADPTAFFLGVDTRGLAMSASKTAAASSETHIESTMADVRKGDSILVRPGSPMRDGNPETHHASDMGHKGRIEAPWHGKPIAMTPTKAHIKSGKVESAKVTEIHENPSARRGGFGVLYVPSRAVHLEDGRVLWATNSSKVHRTKRPHEIERDERSKKQARDNFPRAEREQKDLNQSGGFSYDQHQKVPEHGYMVSRPDSEDVTQGYPTKYHIHTYEQQHQHELSEPGNYEGGWLDGDEKHKKTYLDISENEPDLERAKQKALERHQKGIYDVEHHQTIRTDASGDSRKMHEDHFLHTKCVHNSLGRTLHDGRTAAVESKAVPPTPSFSKPVNYLHDSVAGYNKTYGYAKPKEKDWGAIRSNPKLGAKANEYDHLPNDSTNAHPAYDALKKEVGQQYDHLTKNLGVKVDFVDKDPYTHIHQLTKDLNENHHISVLRTAATGHHPYLTDDENDKFRAVHDAFGHAAIGRGFDRHGEEAAYQAHKQMFSPAARPALATETRGQNNSLVYGGYGKRGSFPPQKVAVMGSKFVNGALGSFEELLNPTLSSITADFNVPVYLMQQQMMHQPHYDGDPESSSEAPPESPHRSPEEQSAYLDKVRRASEEKAKRMDDYPPKSPKKHWWNKSGAFESLLSPILSSFYQGESMKTAYNETVAPEQVNTLRDPECPVCSEDQAYDGQQCQVCGYVAPPQMYQDPNVDTAKQLDLRGDQQAAQGDAMNVGADGQPVPPGNPQATPAGVPTIGSPPGGAPTVGGPVTEEAVDPNAPPTDDDSQPVDPSSADPSQAPEDDSEDSDSKDGEDESKGKDVKKDDDDKKDKNPFTSLLNPRLSALYQSAKEYKGMTYDPNRRTKWKITDNEGYVYASDNPQGTYTATEAEAREQAHRSGATKIEAVNYGHVIHL